MARDQTIIIRENQPYYLGWGLLNIALTTKLDHFWNSIDGKRVLANKYRDIPPSKIKIFSLLINVAVV